LGWKWRLVYFICISSITILGFKILVKVSYSITIWTFAYWFWHFTLTGNRVIDLTWHTVVWNTPVSRIDMVAFRWWTIWNVYTLMCLRIHHLTFRTFRFMDYPCVCLMYNYFLYNTDRPTSKDEVRLDIDSNNHNLLAIT
jgi:hypothetical protein